MVPEKESVKRTLAILSDIAAIAFETALMVMFLSTEVFILCFAYVDTRPTRAGESIIASHSHMVCCRNNSNATASIFELCLDRSYWSCWLENMSIGRDEQRDHWSGNKTRRSILYYREEEALSSYCIRVRCTSAFGQDRGQRQANKEFRLRHQSINDNVRHGPHSYFDSMGLLDAESGDPWVRDIGHCGLVIYCQPWPLRMTKTTGERPQSPEKLL